MGRKIDISEEKCNIVLNLHNDGMKCQEIAQNLEISVASVYNIINGKRSISTKRIGRSGRKSILSKEMKSSITRKLNLDIKSFNFTSPAKIKTSLNLDCSPDTIKRYMKARGYSPMKVTKAIQLTEDHKKERVRFAINNYDRDWSTVLFSDEKRFTLDRPDGQLYQWLPNEDRTQMKHLDRRQGGGKSIMFWASMSTWGTGGLCLIKGKTMPNCYASMSEKISLDTLGRLRCFKKTMPAYIPA